MRERKRIYYTNVHHEKLPVKDFGSWSVRVVKIFDRYGWIAENNHRTQVLTSTNVYDTASIAMDFAQERFKYSY